jgi:ABC-type phosphate transport system substrate-binding protein
MTIERDLLRTGAAALVAGALALAAAPASADPTVACKDATLRPNVVYVAGSTAIKPFLGALAALLAQNSPPYTIVYQSQGSCTGVDAVFNADPTKNVIKDIPASGGKPANWAVFFSSDGTTSTQCNLDPAGNVVDVGASDVYASTCGASAPTGVQIGDYLGPIQAMTFVVPTNSTQRTISAEAAYMVFGMGGNKGAAAPWVDPTYYYVRNASSGTQQMIGKAIGVPATQWWGLDRGGSGTVASQMALLLDATIAEKAIGILAGDVAGTMTTTLRMLKFQATGQSCGYFPDTSPFILDKANVRDGHYPIWGPVHFFARTTAGIPNTAAAALVSRFAAPKPDQTLLDSIIASKLVPRCAMHVTRSSEMGPLASYTTDQRCDCYFEKGITGKTSCQACTQSSDCPSSAPACNYGYCEKP